MSADRPVGHERVPFGRPHAERPFNHLLADMSLDRNKSHGTGGLFFPAFFPSLSKTTQNIHCFDSFLKPFSSKTSS
jgi:hypothetical protein